MGGFKTALKWIAIAIGGLMALLFAAAVFFGLAIELGMFPETHVQTGEELPKKQHEALIDAKILERQETVKYYYSQGFIDVTNSGSILTDRRIIGYWTEEKEDGVQVYAYPIETLDRLVMNAEGSEWEDSEYAVAQRGNNENSLLLFLSIEEDRHLEMVEALGNLIEKNNAAFEKTKADAESAAVD